GARLPPAPPLAPHSGPPARAEARRRAPPSALATPPLPTAVPRRHGADLQQRRDHRSIVGARFDHPIVLQLVPRAPQRRRPQRSLGVRIPGALLDPRPSPFRVAPRPELRAEPPVGTTGP